MSDPTPTRQEVVEANIAAVEALFGTDDTIHISAQCLKDISISLALLVDAGSSST